MIKSPCINICTIDKNGIFCTGCNRTLDEIDRWINLDNQEKKNILYKIEKRKELDTKKSLDIIKKPIYSSP